MFISETTDQKLIYQKYLDSALKRLFPSIEEELLGKIAGKMSWQKIHAGAVLFRQDDIGDSMYVILSGRLEAVVNAHSASENVVGEITKGECAGEMSLITGKNRTATVRAVRDSIIARFSKDDFEQVIAAHPQLVMGISRQIIERLTTTIHQIAREKKFISVAFIPVGNPANAEIVTNELYDALSLHSDTLLLNEQIALELGFHENDDVSFINWLAEKELRHDVIVYSTKTELGGWTKRCIRQADKIILIVESGCDPKALYQKLDWLHKSAVIAAELLILHSPDAPHAADTSQYLQHPVIRRHYHIRKGNLRDIQRVARILTGKANALVLSGGGARGLAHIGIYKALREANIPVDLIGGTSIGSIVAAAIAMDWDPEDVRIEARKAFLVDKPLKDYTLPIISLIKGKQLQEVNQKYFREINIEDLWINYFCVSSNFSTSELKLHRSGSLYKAVTASASIPGVLPPVVDGNHLLIDGGVMNNFPVDIMRDLYPCNIIGIDLSAEKEYELNYDRIPGGWYYLWNKFLPFGRKYKVPGIATIMMKSTLLGSFQKQIKMKEEVDLYLNPPVGRYKLLDMKAFDQLVQLGYDYATLELQKIDIKQKVWQE